MMTGSHGAGDPSETLTPLVAWGAGLRSAQYVDVSSATHHSPQGIVYCKMSAVYFISWAFSGFRKTRVF